MRFKIISNNALSAYLNRKDVLLVDLRSRESYDQGHIPGAAWMDWENIEEGLKELSADFPSHKLPFHWLILYCDYGNISLVTARDLARLGYPVISLNGGFHQWNGPVTSEIRQEAANSNSKLEPEMI